MFIALTLTLLLVLTVLRRIAEPACPGCRGKRWSNDPRVLRCTGCGWSNVVAPQPAPVAELAAVPATAPQYAAPQYELSFR